MDPHTTRSTQPDNSAAISSSNYAGRISLAAAEGAQALVNRCRLRKNIPDPKEFWLAIAYVLDQYDPAIIRQVTDPYTGLPGSLRFPLEIADVRGACERAILPALLSRLNETSRAAAQRAAEAAAAKAAEVQQREVERNGAAPVCPDRREAPGEVEASYIQVGIREREAGSVRRRKP
jgi:hypothetical protein